MGTATQTPADSPPTVPPSTLDSVNHPEPLVYEATLGVNGMVNKGSLIDIPTAQARRKKGLDVVVCGDRLSANRQVARLIESAAANRWILHPPHIKTAGSFALPHYQPDPRPPEGHSFYETDNRKAR